MRCPDPIEAFGFAAAVIGAIIGLLIATFIALVFVAGIVGIWGSIFS